MVCQEAIKIKDTMYNMSIKRQNIKEITHDKKKHVLYTPDKETQVTWINIEN